MLAIDLKVLHGLGNVLEFVLIINLDNGTKEGLVVVSSDLRGFLDFVGSGVLDLGCDFDA